jgi:hypothetical protein
MNELTADEAMAIQMIGQRRKIRASDDDDDDVGEDEDQVPISFFKMPHPSDSLFTIIGAIDSEKIGDKKISFSDERFCGKN